MSVTNLSDQDAIAKIKEIAEACDHCLFTTALNDLPLNTRPMSTQKVDEFGNLWFLSNKFSDKNRQIEADGRVQLFYSNTSKFEFLSLYGEATILIDPVKAEELWTPLAKTWFHEGVYDPELTLIKVEPLDAYYWDTKNNKIVSLLKMATGALIGQTMDDGVEGRLKV